MKSKYLYFFIKRIFDIIIAIIGCLLMIPITIIIKILYIISGDFDTIFFCQYRVGKNGKLFKMYKYRTMCINAETILSDLLKKINYKKEWNEKQKIKNDPRITKMGKYIRKFSIDEIPQFINVLKGEMSLIGPRPLIERELDKHKGNHKIYESVSPGMTGWWIVNSKKVKNYKERLKLEYYYCENCNFILDIKCIFLTLLVFLSNK